jgi:hypothetical protein
MKIIKILTHPLLVLLSFSFIMISGESFGGPYILYIAMALPHGSSHAILAIIGAVLIVCSELKLKNFLAVAFNGVGVTCLLCSLYSFFTRSDYNNDTFNQTVPLITLYTFGILAVGLLLRSLITYIMLTKSRTDNLAF